MARSRAESSTKEIPRQAQGKRPQSIEKRQQPPCRNARLRKAQQQHNELEHLLLSPSVTDPPNNRRGRRRSRANQSNQSKSPQRLPHLKAAAPPCLPHELEANRKLEHKRKRSPESEVFQECPSEKRSRAETNSSRNGHPIENWVQDGSWPKSYLESGDQTWEDLKADTLARGFEANQMNDLARPLLARKKSAASLRRQALEASTFSPTEKTEDKSLPYRNPGYETLLRLKGSHLVESPDGITDDSKLVCQTLLTTTQAVPQDSLFRDDLFMEICYRLRNRNEARVVEDISRLIVPSAETLAIYGAAELKHLIVNVNERWTESIPITDTCPQPDYCVGFDLSAFTDRQLQNLTPYIGDLPPVNYFSFFLATWRMYFPFLACEAKSGIGGLDVADKQNAHSMTMAVRGIVELFKLVHREEELYRKILTFSISHDDKTVRIYGHYALIRDRVATFYRHPIRTFDFTEQNGRKKWTAYRFTKNIYFEFMPKLHELICSAIDKISLDTTSQNPNLPPQIPPSDSFGTDPESEQPDSQEIAQSAPSSQGTGRFKKPRLKATAILQEEADWLRQQLAREREENKQQLARESEESKQRHAELMDQIQKRMTQQEKQ